MRGAPDALRPTRSVRSLALMRAPDTERGAERSMLPPLAVT
jgi:hypothetical protein